MKIVIAGASGLVGTPLCATLKALGHDIWRLTRKPRQLQDIAWDPANGTLESEKLGDTQAVINLAGENIASGRWTTQRKQRIYDSRVQGTRLLVSTFATLPVKPSIWVNASATGYYPQSQAVDETSTPDDSFLARVCVDWEAEALKAQEWGARVALLRLGVVLSPEGGALAKMLPIFKLGLGGVVGNGRQHMSWIALDDVVNVFASAVAKPEYYGPVNLVTPNVVTNREFTQTLGKVLGRPTVLPAPAFALKAAFGEMGQETVLADFFVKPARLEQLEYVYKYPELEGALRHLLGKA